MDLLKIIFRSGVPEAFLKELDTLILDTGYQDDVFVVDVKSHCIELLGPAHMFDLPVKRIIGATRTSIIRQGNLKQGEYYIALGKLIESQGMRNVSAAATGLFKS